jgi:hypothetical protein
MLKSATSAALDRASARPALPKPPVPKGKPTVSSVSKSVKSVKTKAKTPAKPIKPTVVKIHKVREAAGVYQATLFVKDADGKTRSVSISGITGKTSDDALKNAYEALSGKIKAL